MIDHLRVVSGEHDVAEVLEKMNELRIPVQSMSHKRPGLVIIEAKTDVECSQSLVKALLHLPGCRVETHPR